MINKCAWELRLSTEKGGQTNFLRLLFSCLKVI